MTFLRASPSTTPSARLLFAALLAASLVGSASAAQRTWTGANSTSLTDPLNFSGGQAPASSGDAIVFGAAGISGTSLTLNSNTSYSDAAGALLFGAGAPSYTIGGPGVITLGSGPVVNNSGVLQTINNDLIRNASNPLTIGASGGITEFNGTFDLRGTSLNQFSFGSTQGGVIVFNGNLVNTGSTVPTYTLTMPSLTAPASGTVIIGGTNSVITGTLTLGANTTLKLANPEAVNPGQNIALLQSGGTDQLWLASDTALASFNLTTTDGQAARHSIVLGTGASGNAVNQTIGTLRLAPQHFTQFSKAGNVTSGTPALTVGGTTTLGSDGTSGRVSILGADDVNLHLGAITSTSATAQLILSLNGNTPGSTISGVIDNAAAGGIAIAKAGTGTWTLTRANTYTGSTIVNGGTLRADFNASGAPTANILPATTVSLGGGALDFRGKASSATTQTLGAMSVLGSTGGNALVLRAGSGGTLDVTTTGLTVNLGSALTFDLGADTSFRNTAITAAAFVNQGAFLGGNNFARYTASGFVVPAADSDYGTGASVLPNNAGGTGSYFFLNGAQIRTTGLSFKGLRITSTSDRQTLDLGGTTQTFSNSGLLYRGGADNTYTISNGTLSGASTNLLFQVVPAATLHLADSVNLGGGLAASFTKSGAGTLFVSGAKNFTGRWNVTEGVLAFDTLAPGGTASGLGASTPAAGNLFLNGGTLRHTGGAVTTDRSFTIGGTGATIESSGTGPITWEPASSLGFQHNTNFSANSPTAAQNHRITFGGTNPGNNTFGSASGLLANPGIGSLTVVKDGPGKWVLTQANTYQGGTRIQDGTLAITHPAALGTVGVISFGGGTLQYGSGITVDLSHRLQNSTAAIRIDTNGNHVTFQSRLDESNIGGLVKSGAGTLTLGNANLYTGPTTISGGTLALTVGGSFARSTTLLNNATLDVSARPGFTLGTHQTLRGTGAITGSLALAGAFQPGNSPGTHTISGNLTLASTAVTTLELAGPGGVAGTDHDFVSVGGTLTWGGTLDIIHHGTFDSAAQSGAYNLFDFATQSGNFTTVRLQGLALAYDDHLGRWSASSGDVNYSFTLADGVLTTSVIPEPAAFASLAGLSALGLGTLRRRRSPAPPAPRTP